MKHAQGRENTSQSCSCTSCISESTTPSLQRLINQGSKIDKLFYAKFVPLRERKLIEKLVRTRAVYDDVRKQLLSGSNITLNENANLKFKVHTPSPKEIDDIERSSAVLHLVDLVDKGVLLGPHKLNECCSCCSCISKARPPGRYKSGKHMGFSRDPQMRSKSSIISKWSHRKGTRLRRSFKAKHIQSEPCTCTSKLSGLLKNNSKLKHKKKSAQSRPAPETKVLVQDANLKVFKEGYTTSTPKHMAAKTKEKVRRSKAKLKSNIKSEMKKSKEMLQRAKTALRDRVDSMQREYEKREIVLPSQQVIAEERQFHIKKDSITKFKERLSKQNELMDYECEQDCNPEDCAPEECLRKIQFNKFRRGKRKENKKKSKKIQATSGHSLKRCECFNMQVFKKPKINAIGAETSTKLEIRETAGSNITNTSMETENKFKDVIKTQKNRCFCTLKLHTLGKLAQHEKDYSKMTKPAMKEETSKMTTKSTKTKGQNINKQVKIQCDCFEKLKLDKVSNKKTPPSTSMPIETQTIKNNMYRQSTECKRNECVPAVCDPYECLEKIKKRDRHLQTGITTETNHSKLSITTSDATQNINKMNFYSYECAPFDCKPEECSPFKCSEVLRNRHFRTRLDSGTQKYHSTMISKGSTAKPIVKQRHIYTKARKSRYKPASLSSNSNDVSQELSRVIKISSSFSFSIEFSKRTGNTKENTNLEDTSEYRNQVSKNMTPMIHDKAPGPTAVKRPVLKRCLCTLNLQHNKKRRLQTPNVYAVHRLLITKTIRNKNSLTVSKFKSKKNNDVLHSSPNIRPLMDRSSFQSYIVSSNETNDRHIQCTYSAIGFPQRFSTFSFNGNINNERILQSQPSHHISVNEPIKWSDTTYNSQLTRSDLTGVSRLLKPCFCTMNIQIPKNVRKPARQTLAAYECEPGVCIPYECDPHECQKLIAKRNQKQISTTTGDKLVSRADATQKIIHKDATASIKKNRPLDNGTLSKKPPLKLSYKPSPNSRVVTLSSNINFNIEFSKERFLKKIHPNLPAEELHNKNFDKKSRKQDMKTKNRDSDSQSNAIKTEEKYSNTSPERCFCTLKLRKLPKNMQVIENVDQSTKVPKRFLKDTYKLPSVNTGQNTKKGWRPGRLYEDKKNQTRNLSLEAKDSSTQSTFSSKEKNKQIQINSLLDQKPPKSYNQPDIPIRQGIRIKSSLSFNIEFYKENSPEIRAKSSEAELYKKKSNNLQDLALKNGRRISNARLNSKRKKGILEVKQKPNFKSLNDKQVIPKRKKNMSHQQTKPVDNNKEKKVQIKKDVKQKSNGDKNKSDKGIEWQGQNNKSHVKAKLKMPKSKNATFPIMKEDKSNDMEQKLIQGQSGEQQFRDVQPKSNKKQKKLDMQGQAVGRDVIDGTAQSKLQIQTVQSKPHIKDPKVGTFVARNTLLFKRCFCKMKEKKKPRQLICMDKPAPDSPSKSFLKKCACAFSCNTRNNNFKHKEILTYHIQEHRFANLLPYECEPKVCIPGECDPYVCDKIIKKRFLRHGSKSSATEKLRTKSTSSYYDPSTKRRSIQSEFNTKQEYKPLTITSRANDSQGAVKIGSNINFSIEFYKTGAGRKGMEFLEKNLSQHKAKTRSQGSFSDHSRFSRDVQADGTRTEHRGVGTELKRCFCTLKYNLKPSSVKQGPGSVSTEKDKRMDKGVTVQMRRRGLEHHKNKLYAINTRNMTQQTKFSVADHKPNTLEPHECEPNVCIPGECDPYECLQRMNRRIVKLRTYGTSPRHNGTKSTSSMAYSMSDNKSRKIQYSPKQRYNTRSIQSNQSRIRQSISSTPSESERKAFKISSSLHFSVEFTKAGSPQERESYMPTRVIKPKRTRNVNLHTRGRKYSDLTSQTNVLKVESKSSGVAPLLKRCFCTLKLQKVGNLQPNVIPLQQNPKVTSMRSVKTNTKNKKSPKPKHPEITKNIRVGPFLLEQQDLKSMPVTATPMKSKQKRLKTTAVPELSAPEPKTNTTNTRQSSNIGPYECEPGICIPGKCDPYQCYQRIKHRQLRSWRVGTDMITSKDASNLYDGDSKSIGTQSVKDRIKYSTPSQTKKHRLREDRYSYVRDNRRHDGNRTVRVGSSISFNIDFYKDTSPKNNFVALKKRVHNKEKDYYDRLKPKTRHAGVALEMIPIKNVDSQSDGIKYENKASGVHNALKRCFCTLKLHDSTLKTRYTNRHLRPPSKSFEVQEKTVGSEKKTKMPSKKLKNESKRHRNVMCDKYPCTSNKRDIKVTELLTNELATSQRYLFINDNYTSKALPKHKDNNRKFSSIKQQKNQKIIAVNRVTVEETRRKFHQNVSKIPTKIMTNKSRENCLSHLNDSVYKNKKSCCNNLHKRSYNNKVLDLNDIHTLYPYIPSRFKKYKSKMLLNIQCKQTNLIQECFRRDTFQSSIAKIMKRKRPRRVTAKLGKPSINLESKNNEAFGRNLKAFVSRIICLLSKRKQNQLSVNKDRDRVNDPLIHNKTRKSKALKIIKKDTSKTMKDNNFALIKTKRQDLHVASTQKEIERKVCKKDHPLLSIKQNNETVISHYSDCRCSYKNNFICFYCHTKYRKISDSPYIHNKTAQFTVIPPDNAYKEKQFNIKNEQLNEKNMSRNNVLGKYVKLLKKNADVYTSKSKVLYERKDNCGSFESVKNGKTVPNEEKKLKRLRFKGSIIQQDTKPAVIGTCCTCQSCDNTEQQLGNKSVSRFGSLFKNNLLNKSDHLFGKWACGIKKNCRFDECQATVPFQQNEVIEKSNTNPLVQPSSQKKKNLSKKSFFHKYVCGFQRHAKTATIDTQCDFGGPRSMMQFCKTNSPAYKNDSSEKTVDYMGKSERTSPVIRCTCRVCQNLSKGNTPKVKKEIKISDATRSRVTQLMADRCRKLSGGDHITNAICHQTRIQGHQRLKKVYQIPKSNRDDKPCIYKPLFSVGPNLCATCTEKNDEDKNDSHKFDNIGTEPKIKSCIKRTRCKQQFCTCTKKPCICRICPKTAKVIELSSSNWLSPVRHLFINDKYENATNTKKYKYSTPETPEDTCEKMRTMLKIEGCGAKLKVISKKPLNTNKLSLSENLIPQNYVNSPNDAFNAPDLSIDKAPSPVKNKHTFDIVKTSKSGDKSEYASKNFAQTKLSTENPKNVIMQKHQKALQLPKSNLTKYKDNLKEVVSFNKNQTTAIYKPQHVIHDNVFDSPKNFDDDAGCDKNECPVRDERITLQERGPWLKLTELKRKLDKSDRTKHPRDPSACYKDICPAGRNYKRAVQKAKQLEAKKKKKLLEAAKKDKKNIEMEKKKKQSEMRDTELKKKELKLNQNAAASAKKAKKKQALLKSCVCSETCKTHLNKELDKPPQIPDICQIFDTCTCGASICDKEVRKARFKKLPTEMQKLILAKRKKRKAAKAAELKRIKQRTLEYEKQDSLRLKKRQVQDAKQAKQVLKSVKNASTSVLVAESLVDIGKLGFRATAGLFRFASRAVKDPKQVVSSFHGNVKDPTKLKRKVGDTLDSIGLVSTLSRVRKRVGSIDKMKDLTSKLEQNEYTNYLMNARNPKKRLAAAKKPRRRGPPVDFGCSLFMATIRKKRCLAVYYLCPWFYPHCLSLLHIWRQFTDVILFLLAVAVWSPCILALELCRTLVCCAFCQA